MNDFRLVVHVATFMLNSIIRAALMYVSLFNVLFILLSRYISGQILQVVSVTTRLLLGKFPGKFEGLRCCLPFDCQFYP